MKILALLAVRRAIVPALAGNVAVTDLIPAVRIYPEEPPVAPTWPFARVEAATATPFAATGMDGASVAGTVNVFAKGPGADAAIRAGAAVGNALAGAVLDISTDMGEQAKARIRVTAAPLLRDPAEQGAWQVAVQFVASVEARD